MGELPEFSTSQWLEVFDARGPTSEPPDSRGVARAMGLREVDVTAERLELMGQWLADTRLVARPEASGGWYARLMGETLSGAITIPGTDASAPLAMRFERMGLEVPSREEADARDPRALPPLEFSCLNFNLGEASLGVLTVVTEPRPWGLRVRQLKILGDGFEATASGDWRFVEGRHTSQFKIRVDSADLGKMLRSLGYEQVTLTGGQTSVDIDASWEGSPAEFALERMNGVLNVRTEKGRLVDVEPGPGRALGLLNPNALPRRLQLDFSDLFKKGFAYDHIEGAFTFDDGDAYTNNFSIVAPAARIDIAGRVGLATEDYDQIVTVTPDVSSSTLPIAGAIAGGPLGAAAGFLADQLFGGQINKASKYQYQITGSWDDPVIERLGQEPEEESDLTPEVES